MHMADALVAPVVGGVMWAASAGLVSYAARKVKNGLDDSKVPLMGVLGAFVFAAQMINFSIPGTGSSGHLGGGMLLAALLGPHAAFVTMASILAVQAFLFADGGLLALGCNIVNLAFFPCYVAYPLIYKPLVRTGAGRNSMILAAGLAAVVGLQLGSLGVVLETTVSGIAELPFSQFLLLMQPIHLAIGLVEGAVTAAVLLFITRTRHDILQDTQRAEGSRRRSLKPLVAGLLIAALLIAGVLSWFASADPDGLEWSVAQTAGQELTADHGIYGWLADIQHKLAIFPEYTFKGGGEGSPAAVNDKGSAWPGVDSGLSLAGVIGTLVTLLATLALGRLLKACGRRRELSRS